MSIVTKDSEIEVEGGRDLQVAARARARVRVWFHVLACAVFFVFSAELAARLEGWISYGEPFLASPTIEDLKIRTEQGVHGRPGGRYLDYRLNGHGFRGPEITRVPSPGTERIMVLAASEGFGVGLGPGQEFPRRLDEILTSKGPYEVVNASINGITPRSMEGYWENWASTFKPRYVLIYPNALFYFSDNLSQSTSEESLKRIPAEGAATAVTQAAPQGDFPPFSSRLELRLQQAISFPDWFQAWRDRRSIDAAVREHGEGWAFASVPRDRLQWFVEDLDRLVKSVRETGATAIVMTHPLRATSVSRDRDRKDLRSFRANSPRASEAVVLDFAREASAAVRELGAERGFDVIDLEAEMNGDHDAFMDMVHFNERGSRLAAESIARFFLDGARRSVPGPE